MSSHHRVSAAQGRFGLSLVAAVMLLSCGGSPTSTAGQGAANLPPQTNPGVKSSDAAKDSGPKRSLKGTIVNAVTGEPIDKAMFFVEGVTTTIPSTPIPAAGSPGPAAKPSSAPGGGGGLGGAQPATGGYQIAANGDPSPLVSGGSVPSLPPGASVPSLPPGASVPSLPPGVSPPPGALGTVPGVSPGMTPSPGSSASPAAGSSPATTADASAAPGPAGTPFPLASYKPDRSGKFEVKDLPEGAYSITFYAPGYEAQTFQGNLSDDLDVKLRPLDIPTHDLHELKGVVRQATNQPAGNAEVEVSSLAGKFPGLHMTTDDGGAFTAPGLVSGNYSVAAWTSSLEGEVTTFNMVKEVPVSLGKEKRTVSPTLILRAVTTPVLLAGTVGGSAEVSTSAGAKGASPAAAKPGALKPRTVQAFVDVGDGEIPLASTSCGADGYFRLRLPPLPEGATYHLVASGENDAGQVSYVHKYNISVADPKLDIPLPDAPSGITVTDHSKSPAFSWESTGSDVTAYRVAIESVGQDGDTLWEGWTSGQAIRLPSSKDFTLLHDGESYRYTLTAIRLSDKGKLDLPSLAIQPWDSSGMTKATTFEVGRAKPGSKTTGDSYKPLSVPQSGSGAKAASAKPSTKPSSTRSKGKKGASPSPSASVQPSPKSPRIKPTTDL